MGARKRDGKIVDHINRDKLDNRRSNLRFVNASESSSNVKPHSASGFRGVYPYRGRWRAKAKLAGEYYSLGTYDTPEEAAQVSHQWRVEHLPGYVAEDLWIVTTLGRSLRYTAWTAEITPLCTVMSAVP